jgi:anti-sigma B factor antagonist
VIAAVRAGTRRRVIRLPQRNLTFMGSYDGVAVVTQYSIGRRRVLAVDGEVDLASVPLLSDAVGEALEAGAAELWIDLTDTLFMDSSGLHALLETRQKAAELNRRFAIVCPDGPVRRVFELAGVLDQLPVFDDRAAAHRAA